MEHESTNVVIPDDVTFSDLRLARDANGRLSFNWAPIERICASSGIDVNVPRSSEDSAAWLITYWYAEHIRRGGARDPVYDNLVANTKHG